MSIITLLYIIIGSIIFLTISIALFIWKGWPAIKNHFAKEFTPDVNRCWVKFHSGDPSGGIWSDPYDGALAFADPDAMTYDVAIGKDKYEVTIRNNEGFEWQGGNRLINCEVGSCIGHSPKVFHEADPTPYPPKIFSARLLAAAKVKAAESIASEHGLDPKLILIAVIGIVAVVGIIMGILAGSGTFKKAPPPTINNYYTTNTTSNTTATAGQTGPVTVNGTQVK